ncbi:hypothetical protein Dimus_001047 [Dionaea muscipula]
MTDRDSLPLHHCSRRGLQAEPTKRGQRPATLEAGDEQKLQLRPRRRQGRNREREAGIDMLRRDPTRVRAPDSDGARAVVGEDVRVKSRPADPVQGFTPVRERTCASEGEIGRIQGRRWPAPIRVELKQPPFSSFASLIGEFKTWISQFYGFCKYKTWMLYPICLSFRKPGG